ncbi:MAG: N-6 DNA methylase [Xanthobacteraceae bacterium]|nr:N-6 DNA methylase [Xanthobacteraceae bacterium]
MPASDEQKTILNNWASNLAAGNYDAETKNDGEFIQRILIDVLGYQGSSAGERWTVGKNQGVGSGNVDVALGEFVVGQPPKILAPFELKGAKFKNLDAVMPGRNKTPVQQAWEYAMDAKGAKWVLVSNYREIRLYAVGYGRKNYEFFDLSKMTDEKEYLRFWTVLSAYNLLGGRTLKLLEDSENVEKEITEQLYSDYKIVRNELVAEILAKNKALGISAVELSQTILDRVLFIAFAEDKGLLRPDTLRTASEHKSPFNTSSIWSNLKALFNAIDTGNAKLNIPGYNGGLFKKDSRIDKLQLNDKVCKKLTSLGEYDFDSEVNVNILGHIFEQSISDLEEIKKKLDPKTVLEEAGSKRRRDGIFYTPALVTRHIVEQALERWLEDRKEELGFAKLKPLTDQDYASIKVPKSKSKAKSTRVTFNANVQKHIKVWEAYRDRLAGIKVVDPACGSGAFLNEVFDFLLREGEAINRQLETLYGGQINLFRWDTHILTNNIYGVDINRESVEITKLSLWLKTANRNEKLSYLDDNVRVGNSLISDKKIAGALAFSWEKEFAKVLDNGGFDVVVGNPPYVDSEAMTKYWAKEREYITDNYKQTRGNWDLYIAFLELGLNLLAKGGYLAFITPDKWISKPFGAELRKRALPGLVSILPVGRDVFESALVDSIITTVQNNTRPSLDLMAIENGEVRINATIPKGQLDGDAGFDRLLSPHHAIIEGLDGRADQTLSNYAVCENACATSDTYVLGEIIADAKNEKAFDPKEDYKVANTGTLSRYGFRWGLKPMRYLKKDYLLPVVEKKEFKKRLGATYNRRAESPKIIIKGLTLLDGALDLEARFIPGKSTLVIPSDSADDLKFLAGIINSKLVSFYVKQKYSSASYNGGVNFTPDMINGIPIPKIIERKLIIEKVDAILLAQEKITAASKELLRQIRASAKDAKTARFEDWFEMEPSTFIDELERAGVKLSVKQKSEWTGLLEEQQASVAKLHGHKKAAEKAIDAAIFKAFKLSGAERELVEASL